MSMRVIVAFLLGVALAVEESRWRAPALHVENSEDAPRLVRYTPDLDADFEEEDADDDDGDEGGPIFQSPQAYETYAAALSSTKYDEIESYRGGDAEIVPHTVKAKPIRLTYLLHALDKVISGGSLLEAMQPPQPTPGFTVNRRVELARPDGFAGMALVAKSVLPTTNVAAVVAKEKTGEKDSNLKCSVQADLSQIPVQDSVEALAELTNSITPWVLAEARANSQAVQRAALKPRIDYFCAHVVTEYLPDEEGGVTTELRETVMVDVALAELIPFEVKSDGQPAKKKTTRGGGRRRGGRGGYGGGYGRGYGGGFGGGFGGFGGFGFGFLELESAADDANNNNNIPSSFLEYRYGGSLYSDRGGRGDDEGKKKKGAAMAVDEYVTRKPLLPVSLGLAGKVYGKNAAPAVMPGFSLQRFGCQEDALLNEHGVSESCVFIQHPPNQVYQAATLRHERIAAQCFGRYGVGTKVVRRKWINHPNVRDRKGRLRKKGYTEEAIQVFECSAKGWKSTGQFQPGPGQVVLDKCRSAVAKLAAASNGGSIGHF